jgi:hypothetical protein
LTYQRPDRLGIPTPRTPFQPAHGWSHLHRIRC